MSDWLCGYSPRTWSDCGGWIGCCPAWSPSSIPFPIAAKDRVYNNAPSLLYLEKFVERIVSFGRTSFDARRTQVIVYEEKINLGCGFGLLGDDNIPGQSRHLCLTPTIVLSHTLHTTPLWTTSGGGASRSAAGVGAGIGLTAGGTTWDRTGSRGQPEQVRLFMMCPSPKLRPCSGPWLPTQSVHYRMTRQIETIADNI